MTRFELEPKQSRSEEAPAMQTGPRGPDAPDSVCPVLGSFLEFLSQRFSEFSHSGADSRLHSSERLIQLSCCFFISQFCEKCGFDRISFFWTQYRKRIPQ